MPFKYVLVPASANEVMQELVFETDIEDLAKDIFREHVEKYFSALGGIADKSVLLKQLQDRTGVNLQDKADTGEMTGMALDKLLHSTSVEIFPVMLPTEGTKFISISVYLDDKGVAKDLEENPRISGMVQACGYPGQTFRGDCFVGRVYDDNHDEWRRVDFPLSDCTSDADWIACCKQQRSKRSNGDMQSLSEKVGVKNPAHITPAMLQEKNEGETTDYKWRQVDDEVEITFKKDGLGKGDVKLVKVAFSRQKLKVEAKNEVLVDAALYGSVVPDDCTWTLSDGILQVTLIKVDDSGNWPKLLGE